MKMILENDPIKTTLTVGMMFGQADGMMPASSYGFYNR
jgi:hypothetical protein